jgi:predicted DCC family thiol-disulfide oxidoreductase YuxK
MVKKEVPVLLVDSKCAVCNKAVRFLRKHQREDRVIMFRSLYAEDGKKYLRKYGLPEDYDDSLVLIENGAAYISSDAVLRVAGFMKGGFPLLTVFLYIPRKGRDYLYNLIAKHRHRLG